MFKSSLGCINADLNGALNIIKKVFKEFNYETANLDIKFFKSIIKVRPKIAITQQSSGIVESGDSFNFKALNKF